MLPAALEAVRMYVTVLSGVTTLVPVKATSPISRFIRTTAASETFQLSVEESPEVILPGLASKELMTGFAAPVVESTQVQLAAIIKIDSIRNNDFFISCTPFRI